MNATALVSVIIPAFNASATIRETLDSVFAQTYPCLEIILVDDGSTDGTATLAREHAGERPILVLEQANAGVAAARNAGLEAARGEYVVPLDADDLLHPARIANHVGALEAAGAEFAVAYSPCYVLDGDGQITGASPRYEWRGRVFLPHLFVNLVGNGSGMTIRRKAALGVGGYPTFLRDAGVQGCEDYYLQLRVSQSWSFINVPGYLTGYRRLANAMSAQETKMLRSRVLAMRRIELPRAWTTRAAAGIAIAFSVGKLVAWVRREQGHAAAGAEARAQSVGPVELSLNLAASGLFTAFWGLKAVLRLMVGAKRPVFERGVPYLQWARQDQARRPRQG